MKLRVLSKSLFLVVSLSVAGPWLVRSMYGDTPAPNSSDATKKPADKVKHEIRGVPIARTTGGYLGLEIENDNFKLSFYDKDKAPVAPDVALATIRWHAKDVKVLEFVSLTPGDDGKSLASSKAVRRPWVFKLTILLFADGNSDPVESYSVDYSG